MGKKIKRAFIRWFAVSIGVMLLASAGIFYISAKKDGETRRDMTAKAIENSDDLLTREMKFQTERYTACFGDLIESQLSVVSAPMYITAESIEQIYDRQDTQAEQAVPYAKELSGEEPKLHWLLPKGMSMEGELQGELRRLGSAGGVFQRFTEENSHILRIYFTSVSGINIGYDGDYGKKPDVFDGRETVWYKNAVEAGGLTLSEAYTDAFEKRLTVTFSIPCVDKEGNLLGVLAADLLIDELEQMIQDMKPGWGGYAMLVSGEGKMVAAKNLTGENAADMNYFLGDHSKELLREMESKDSGALESTIHGEEKYLIYAKIDSVDWSTVIVVDRGTILKAAAESAHSLTEIENEARREAVVQFVIICVLWAGISGAILLLGLALSGKVSARISGPIIELCHSVRGIREDELCYEAHIKTGDEIEELDQAFAAMAESLRTYIGNLARLTAEKERIETELSVATQIQASMLPCIFPPFPDREEVDIYATMEPAREVGGDFYDFFLADKNHLCMIMADVSGKGIPAALFMVVSKTLLKDNVLSGKALSGVLERVNNQLCENNEAEMFVTAFAAVLNLSNGEMSYVNAGHNPPAVRRKDGELVWLKNPSGFVLAGMQEMQYQEGSIRLQAGDKFFAYTDGVTEAMNSSGEIYGTERLEHLIQDKWNEKITASSMLWTAREDIRDFVKEADQADDITMLACCYLGRVLKSCMVVEAEEKELPRVREFMENRLWEADYPPKGTQIQLAAEEIFVNIARYAYPEQENQSKGTVEIGCTVKENQMILTFADSGIPYNPLEREDPDILAPAGQRPVGGLGIYLVKKSMDQVEYEYRDGKNVLTITQNFC